MSATVAGSAALVAGSLPFVTAAIAATVLAGAAAAVAADDGRNLSRTRLARLRPPPETPGAGSRPAVLRGRPHQMAAGVAGLGCAVLVGGLGGVALGLVVAAALGVWLARLEPRAARRRRLRLAADLPVAADLLAACVAAGAPLPEAVDAVAGALEGPVSSELGQVAARVRLGADPAAAWLTLAREPALAPLGRALARAVESGAPLAETMARLADDRREERRRAALADARAVGVRAVAPLGLCFLPAFVLLGVVPLVAGVARTVMGGV